MPRLSCTSCALLAHLAVACPTHAAFERPGLSWPAGAELAGVQTVAWRLASERLYRLPDLDCHHLGLASPLGPVVLGLGADLVGPERHRELGLHLGIGAETRPGRLRLSAGAHLLQLAQEGSPPTRRLAPSLGSQVLIRDQWRLSVWMRGAARGLAPPLLSLEATHLVQGEGRLSVALLGDRPPWRLRLHARRRLSPRVDLELGTTSTPRQFRLGLGARAGSCWVRYRIDTHAYLGASHHISVGSARP